MEVLLTAFALAGMAVCGVGLVLGLAVAAAGALQTRGRRIGLRAGRAPAVGGIGFGLAICLWWAPAACASIGLLQRDAAVVSASLALWIAGAPVVLGAGSLARRSTRRPEAP